jgi:two-component system, NtrC family, sensor kinase
MSSKSRGTPPDFKGIGYSKIGYFKETRSKIKELESLNIELARRHNKLEAVFNSISDGLTILDRDLNIVFANQVQKTNFPDANLIGSKCFKAFFNKADACRDCPVLQTMETQDYLSGEIFVKDNESGGRYYDWTTSPVHDPSGRVYEILLLMRDVTQRKEYEYKLMQADRMAAIGFLAAGVAHEINNPLTSIAGFSEALLKRLKNPRGDINRQQMLAFEEYLEIINTEAYRCKDIIFNLQDFSRNSADDFEILSIDAIIRDTLSLFRQRAKDHNIRIRYDARLVEGKDAIHGKKSQLKHLFLNLLIRAFKSVEDGGNLWLQSLSNGKQVKVALSDTGSQRGPACAEASPGGGDGLSGSGSEVDLSICYNIVQHHKGVMQFEMSEKIGDLLTIYFPVATSSSGAGRTGNKR